MISKSKKNILFILSLIAILLAYCFILLPAKQTPDSFNSYAVQKEIKDLETVQQGKASRGETGFSALSGRFIFAENNYNLELQNKLVTAFEDKNYVRFAHLRMKDFAYNGIAPDELLLAKSPFPGKDTQHLYNQTILRYQGYLNEKIPITYKLLEQKTALQTIQNFIMSSVVLGLFFSAIYFSCDMLTKDRQNRTILQGLPISWYRFINVKSFVAFVYTFGVLIFLFILAIGVLSAQNGIGYMNLHVPIRLPEQSGVFGLNDYNSIPMSKFLLMAVGFLPILVYLFIRLSAIFSLLFKNTWSVLMASTVILFMEKIYYSRSTRELFGIDVSNLPQTYFEFGKIVTGEKNYLLNMETITYGKGFLVLFITIIVIEIVLLTVSRIINKQRFYQGA